MNARKIIGLIFVVGALSACGNGLDPIPDAGPLITQYKLETGAYVQTAPTNIVDGCNVNPNDPQNPVAGKVLQLVNTNGAISLFGSASPPQPTGTPPMPANGSGNLSNNYVMLQRDNSVTEGTANPPCTFHRYVEHDFTVTSDNHVTSNYTRRDTAHSGCTATADCTTTWTYNLSK